MSKHNNVNPGQYKEGGREHQGDDILHAVEKQQYTQAQKNIEEFSSNNNDEASAPGGKENRAGNATASSNSSSNQY